MKHLFQACACLVIAIAISYLVFENVNAEQKLTNPSAAPQTVKTIQPIAVAKMPAQALMAMQVELGG